MTVGNMGKTTVVSSVLCDDVRTEDSGKEILIGVYSGTVTVHSLPTPLLALRWWVNLEIQGPCQIKISFRITDHHDKQVFLSEVSTGTEDEVGLGSVHMGPIPLAVSDPNGLLRFEYKEDDGDWVAIMTKETLYRGK